MEVNFSNHIVKAKLIIITFASLVSSEINGQTPTIISFSPDSGAVGTLITIIGANLEKPTAFTVGGVNAIVVSDTSALISNYGDTLVGLIMPGSGTGVVSVTSAKGTGNGSGSFKVTATSYPSIQQGSKLVGTGAVGKAWQGSSVSISADGNTAIVGGGNDNSGTGTIWVYTRSGGVWTQQGNKLVGSGAIGLARQGFVAISADGNTAIVGGTGDNNGIGAAWIFTRSGGIWTQQGNKLVGTGAVGPTYVSQGSSVSISADGNTAIVGGSGDNNHTGATWVFTRSNGVWSQQGNKLVGTGYSELVSQGNTVAISADGNTVIVAGATDSNGAGPAWIFTRTDSIWTQQGNYLVGTGSTGSANQQISVSISADGNTAIVGGTTVNSGQGAAWIFTRSGGVWSQQGNWLVGQGVVSQVSLGSSVSISADGNTAIVGGVGDNNNTGAVWVFTRLAGVWTQEGNKLVGTGAIGQAFQGMSVSLSADGNTVIVGGDGDNSLTGASYIFASSITTGIDEVVTIKNQLAIFPNPNNGRFTIQSANEGDYSIVNTFGEIIQRLKLHASNNYTMNIENLSNGIYFFVGFNNNQMSEQKMVVTK